MFLDSINKPASSEENFTSGFFSPRLVMFEQFRGSSLGSRGSGYLIISSSSVINFARNKIPLI